MTIQIRKATSLSLFVVALLMSSQVHASEIVGTLSPVSANLSTQGQIRGNVVTISSEISGNLATAINPPVVVGSGGGGSGGGSGGGGYYGGFGGQYLSMLSPDATSPGANTEFNGIGGGDYNYDIYSSGSESSGNLGGPSPIVAEAGSQLDATLASPNPNDSQLAAVSLAGPWLGMNGWILLAILLVAIASVLYTTYYRTKVSKR